MSALRFPIAVDFRRVTLDNRWISERWEPFAVQFTPEASAGDIGPPVASALDGAGDAWRFSNFTLELHVSEAEGFYLNLTSPEPKVFVMWRARDEGAEDPAAPPIRPEVVTVSYNEAGRLMDGGERVDAVPMSAEILEWVRPFVAEHYKAEPRRKVRRNDPFADRDASGASRRER